jgi:hypothetical protein
MAAYDLLDWGWSETELPPCVFCKRTEGAGETCCAIVQVVGPVYELHTAAVQLWDALVEKQRQYEIENIAWSRAREQLTASQAEARRLRGALGEVRARIEWWDAGVDSPPAMKLIGMIDAALAEQPGEKEQENAAAPPFDANGNPAADVRCNGCGVMIGCTHHGLCPERERLAPHTLATEQAVKAAVTGDSAAEGRGAFADARDRMNVLPTRWPEPGTGRKPVEAAGGGDRVDYDTEINRALHDAENERELDLAHPFVRARIADLEAQNKRDIAAAAKRIVEAEARAEAAEAKLSSKDRAILVLRSALVTVRGGYYGSIAEIDNALATLERLATESSRGGT